MYKNHIERTSFNIFDIRIDSTVMHTQKHDSIIYLCFIWCIAESAKEKPEGDRDGDTHRERENRYLLEVVSVIIIISLLSTPDIDSQYSLLKVLHRLNAFTFVLYALSHSLLRVNVFLFFLINQWRIYINHVHTRNQETKKMYSRQRNNHFQFREGAEQKNNTIGHFSYALSLSTLSTHLRLISLLFVFCILRPPLWPTTAFCTFVFAFAEIMNFMKWLWLAIRRDGRYGKNHVCVCISQSMHTCHKSISHKLWTE